MVGKCQASQLSSLSHSFPTCKLRFLNEMICLKFYGSRNMCLCDLLQNKNSPMHPASDMCPSAVLSTGCEASTSTLTPTL